MLIAAAIVGAAAVCWAARLLQVDLRAARDESTRARTLTLLQMFSGGIADTRAHPAAMLTWLPLARAARQLFPTECAALDAASGRTFPFTAEDVQAAHAQWTAGWLAWERTHDGEYKMKAAILEEQLVAAGGSAAARAKLDAVEREKLDLYQRRYEEYVRVAKALQSLTV